MITQIRSSDLMAEIEAAGHWVDSTNNIITTSDDNAVQAIIDAFSELDYAQASALKSVKDASASKRLEYVTQAAGKDAEYKTKEAEAKQFDSDATVGVFMQARINLTSESASTVATEWNAKSVAWQSIGAQIAALEDKASADINAELDWEQCQVIADAAIITIKGL